MQGEWINFCSKILMLPTLLHLTQYYLLTVSCSNGSHSFHSVNLFNKVILIYFMSLSLWKQLDQIKISLTYNIKRSYHIRFWKKRKMNQSRFLIVLIMNKGKYIFSRIMMQYRTWANDWPRFHLVLIMYMLGHAWWRMSQFLNMPYRFCHMPHFEKPIVFILD